MPRLSYNQKRLLADPFTMTANKRLGIKKLLGRQLLCLILILSPLASDHVVADSLAQSEYLTWEQFKR